MTPRQIILARARRHSTQLLLLLFSMCALFLLLPAIEVVARSTYGPGVGADSLANTLVGGPTEREVSYRFRASTNARLDSVTIYIQTGSGYSGGDGGTLRITVRPDDGSARHRPARRVLTSKTVRRPEVGAGNTYRFDSPPRLTKGSLYHVVFTNVHPEQASNYVSVNALYVYGDSRAPQPAMPRRGWARLVRDQGGAWSRGSGSGSFTPIMGLRYSNGVTAGQGYMEVWVRSTATVSGSNKAREVFRVRGRDRKVSSVSVRAKRVEGRGPLRFRIRKSNGDLVAKGAIPASRIGLSSSGSPRDAEWATVKLSTPRVLRRGRRYEIVFKAARGTRYRDVGYPRRCFIRLSAGELLRRGQGPGQVRWSVGSIHGLGLAERRGRSADRLSVAASGGWKHRDEECLTVRKSPLCQHEVRHPYPSYI